MKKLQILVVFAVAMNSFNITGVSTRQQAKNNEKNIAAAQNNIKKLLNKDNFKNNDDIVTYAFKDKESKQAYFAACKALKDLISSK